MSDEVSSSPSPYHVWDLTNMPARGTPEFEAFLDEVMDTLKPGSAEASKKPTT